jgi:hypothetical protein
MVILPCCGGDDAAPGGSPGSGGSAGSGGSSAGRGGSSGSGGSSGVAGGGSSSVGAGYWDCSGQNADLCACVHFASGDGSPLVASECTLTYDCCIRVVLVDKSFIDERCTCDAADDEACNAKVEGQAMQTTVVESAVRKDTCP